jgi:hypothetical protein
MKKFAILGVLAIAFALSASLVFASQRGRDGGCGCNDRRGGDEKCCPETNVNVDNDADVLNVVVPVSNTGVNRINGGGKSTLSTGVAYADGLANTTANASSITVASRRLGKIDVDVDNDADVDNIVVAVANTGINEINGGQALTNSVADSCCRDRRRCGHDHEQPCCPESSLTTGNATSYGTAMTVVNSSVIAVQ